MYVCMYMCFVSEVLAMSCEHNHMVVGQREGEGDHDDIVIIMYQIEQKYKSWSGAAGDRPFIKSVHI